MSTPHVTAATAAPTPPRLSQPAPVAPEALDAAAQAIAGGKGVNDPALRNLPPAALDEAQKRAMRLRLDTMPPVEGSMQPMSARQGQPDLAQVINDMMATGFVTQSNLEAMRQVAGPDKDAQLAEILRSNNIQILPDEGAEQFRSAVYRPEEGAATLQRGAPDATLEEAQYVPTGRQFVGKSPMQAPMPGSAIVPLPRVSGESAATTAGSEGVKVKTQPQIVAGEERAKRLEKLRGDLPTARQETQTIVDNLAQRINAIDEFLRSPYRRSIIGSIEGRIPRLLQDEERADAQRLWDTITNNDVLQTILAARAQTGTGGSPLSSMSNSDLQFIIGASSPLTQTGSEAKQEQQLLKMRDKLYGKLQQAQQTFNDTYREISREAPNIRLNAPRVAPRYSAGPAAGVQRTKGGATVSNW